MKKVFALLLIVSGISASAQQFEGSIKYDLKIQFNDPKRQAQLEQGQKRDKEEMKRLEALPKVNDNDTTKSAQRIRAQRQGLESGVGAPSGLIVNLKKGDGLAKALGGDRTELLYLNKEDNVYEINSRAKNYRLVKKRERMSPVDSIANATAFIGQPETATISGYLCRKYTRSYSFKDRKFSQEVWVTTELPDIDMKFLGRQRVGMHFIPADKIDGVPLKIVSIDRDGTFTLQAVQIEKKKVDDKLFTLPPDYVYLNEPKEIADARLKKAKENQTKSKKGKQANQKAVKNQMPPKKEQQGKTEEKKEGDKKSEVKESGAKENEVK